MQVGVLGSKVKPQKFKCGGWTGCEQDHDFFAPTDVLVLSEATPLEDFRGHEHVWTQTAEDEAVRLGTLYVGDKAVIPTLLGLWYEDSAVN